jgi:hypothetical protein
MTNDTKFYVYFPNGRQLGPFSEGKARAEGAKALQDPSVKHVELYREVGAGGKQFFQRLEL